MTARSVKIDPEKCIGCGTCAALCAEVFEMIGDKARVKQSLTELTCASEAAERCPTQAITLEHYEAK